MTYGTVIGKTKEYGVVYTPIWVVDLILDKTISTYSADMKVCDPACGDGAFLARVVEKICDNLPAKSCRRALQNITGIDIDNNALKQCKRKLDEVLKAKGKRIKIEWNLHCMDATNRKLLAPYESHFDYVVGNPPYVRIQNLGKERRTRLQQEWKLARHGSTDLYIAFFEIGVFLLNRSGRLGYITPNTFAKTSAGRELRRFLLENLAITCLIDFGSYQVFKHATTYSLITVLAKEATSEKFALYRHDGATLSNKGTVPISYLSGKEFWTLDPEKTLKKIQQIKKRGNPLRVIADIHVGIQTLADSTFILEKKNELSDVVIANSEHGEVKLERAITRPILKASVMKNGKDAKQRIIIFPYINGQLIPEKQLAKEYPLAYRYLKEHKSILLARDKGGFDDIRWYAFGREFGLTTTFGDKLLTSGMNIKPNFQKCPSPEYTFYSGYCVKPKSGVDADKLLDSLNSSDMEFYIRHTSRDYQNGWKSFAKSFIENYGVPHTVSEGYKPGSVQTQFFADVS